MLQEKSAMTGSQTLTAKGWGSFFFPPIFVGTHLERDALHHGNGGGRAFVKALDTEYKGRLLIVSREGLVVIAEEGMTRALELLNEIMATILFRSPPVYGIKETDLVECSLNLASKEIEAGVWKYSTRSQGLLEEGFEGWHPKFYHPDNIKGFIRRAERMNNDPSVQLQLQLMQQAFTLHEESAYTPAFLLAWLGVESWLYNLERRLLADQQLEASGAKADTDAGWSAAQSIETLYHNSMIDARTYDEMTRLYRKREALLLSADKANSSESEACFHFALSQLRKTTLAPE